mmetsp:Transcript_41229/g.67009  ORF Transcript_41229/g.67009 Transcript_41229/m.67009 type:complete len:251 (-) Transcript_41229:123-875(-)
MDMCALKLKSSSQHVPKDGNGEDVNHVNSGHTRREGGNGTRNRKSCSISAASLSNGPKGLDTPTLSIDEERSKEFPFESLGRQFTRHIKRKITSSPQDRSHSLEIVDRKRSQIGQQDSNSSPTVQIVKSEMNLLKYLKFKSNTSEERCPRSIRSCAIPNGEKLSPIPTPLQLLTSPEGIPSPWIKSELWDTKSPSADTQPPHHLLNTASAPDQVSLERMSSLSSLGTLNSASLSTSKVPSASTVDNSTSQ